MRGVPVAVLDMRNLSEEQGEELEEKGVRYWRCDVGNREEVESAVGSVREEVRLLFSYLGVGCVASFVAGVMHKTLSVQAALQCIFTMILEFVG